MATFPIQVGAKISDIQPALDIATAVNERKVVLGQGLIFAFEPGQRAYQYKWGQNIPSIVEDSRQWLEQACNSFYNGSVLWTTSALRSAAGYNATNWVRQAPTGGMTTGAIQQNDYVHREQLNEVYACTKLLKVTRPTLNYTIQRKTGYGEAFGRDEPGFPDTKTEDQTWAEALNAAKASFDANAYPYVDSDGKHSQVDAERITYPYNGNTYHSYSFKITLHATLITFTVSPPDVPTAKILTCYWQGKAAGTTTSSWNLATFDNNGDNVANLTWRSQTMSGNTATLGNLTTYPNITRPTVYSPPSPYYYDPNATISVAGTNRGWMLNDNALYQPYVTADWQFIHA